MKVKNILLAIGLCILIFGCDDARYYEKNVDFDNKIWLADSVASFPVAIENSDQTYNLYLNIRNVNTYPYHNLYVKYSIADSSGNEVAGDLINNSLFHEKTGKPYGSGLGDIFSHQFLFLEDYKFGKSGTYTIEVQQFMRQDSLKGIVSAGVRVEHAQFDD